MRSTLAALLTILAFQASAHPWIGRKSPTFPPAGGSGVDLCAGEDPCANGEIAVYNAALSCWECGAAPAGLSFVTWNAPAGTDPVAELASDTMNLAVGGPITLVGDAATDTLTWDCATCVTTATELWQNGVNGYFSNTEMIIVGADAAEGVTNAGFTAGAGALNVKGEGGFEGEVFSNIGFTSGASTTYGDNVVTPSATLVITRAVQSGQNGQDGAFIVYSEQGAGDFSVTLQPHAAMTQNVTLTFPADDGTGTQALLTDGAGALSWGSAPAAGHDLLSATHSDTTAGAAVLGDVVYADGTPKWTKLAGNTSATKNFFTQTGTGALSAAPAWGTIADADVPATLSRDTESPGAGDITGSLSAGYTIGANAVALGPDTTGAYVENLAEGTAIDVSGGGAETATVTVAWDSTEVEATTWGAGGNASNAWTFNLSAADPTLTFGADEMLLSSTGTATTFKVGTGGADGKLRLYSEEGVTDQFVAFQPHADMTQDVTYTLPPDDGAAGTFLQSDGAGNLVWAAAGGGDAATLDGLDSTDFLRRTADDTYTPTGWDVMAATVDGADNSYISFYGGGAAGTSRGAEVDIKGNEAAGGGDINLTAGSNGELVLLGLSVYLASDGAGNGTPIVFEGDTIDGSETTLDVIDPTADRAINFPNDSGTVILSSTEQWIDGTNGVYNRTNEAVHVTPGTDIAETIADVAFNNGGGDLFVSDQLGVEGAIYADGALNVVGASKLEGAVTIGATGTAISDSYAGSAVIDFPSTSATTADSAGITVTGASLGDTCSVGTDAEATWVTGATFTCRVSAADTVIVRFTASGANINPGSDTFRVRVFDP